MTASPRRRSAPIPRRLTPDLQAAWDDLSAAVQACVERQMEKDAALAASIVHDNTPRHPNAAPQHNNSVMSAKKTKAAPRSTKSARAARHGVR